MVPDDQRVGIEHDRTGVPGPAVSLCCTGRLTCHQREPRETQDRQTKNPECKETHTTDVQESVERGQLAFSLTGTAPFQVPNIGRLPLDPSSSLGYGFLDPAVSSRCIDTRHNPACRV